MKIRIKFRKYGMMRYIGHLDMMRYFQKAMRRADIDIAYSEGFSPHQIMSFASPLGVGLTSDGEYLDIEVRSTRSSKDSLQALNDVMAEGVQVIQYRLLPEGTKNAMSSVAAADYTVTYKDPQRNPFTLDTLTKALQGFYQEQDEILVTKKTKKSEKTMDLKPLIYYLKAFESEQQGPCVALKVCSGSSDNIKPELVMEAFYTYCQEHGFWDADLHEQSFDPLKVQVHRAEVYARPDQELIPLGDLGQEIMEELA